MSLPKAHFYQVRSTQHANLHNLSVTIGNDVAHLYTDGDGLMRIIRDSEGHPFIPREVALVFAEQPVDNGWVITPLPEDEPEPPEEIVPVDVHSETGQLVFTTDKIAGRLKEALLAVRDKNTLLELKDRAIKSLKERVLELEAEKEQLERENTTLLAKLSQHAPEPALTESKQPAAPAAPMIKHGKFAKARKNRATEVAADDSSVGTYREQNPDPTPNFTGLDDIPHTE